MFDMACTAQLRGLAFLEGLTMAAAIETSTGVALHSIRRPSDLDLLAMCKAMADLVRCHAAARVEPRDSVQVIFMQTRQHAHIVRPLRREPLVALYVVVEVGEGRVARARVAVADAAFVLDTLPAIA
jgi:hypothetical protein